MKFITTLAIFFSLILTLNSAYAVEEVVLNVDGEKEIFQFSLEDSFVEEVIIGETEIKAAVVSDTVILDTLTVKALEEIIDEDDEIEKLSFDFTNAFDEVEVVRLDRTTIRAIDSVLNDIIDIYNAQKPFEIKVKGIEKHENIMWIRMYSNEDLEALATSLNVMLRDKYGVPLHEYDLDFIFHTTLFMDDDAEKINAAHNLLGDLPLPKTLTANTFVIGKSETGENGTYMVYKTVRV